MVSMSLSSDGTNMSCEGSEQDVRMSEALVPYAAAARSRRKREMRIEVNLWDAEVIA